MSTHNPDSSYRVYGQQGDITTDGRGKYDRVGVSTISLQSGRPSDGVAWHREKSWRAPTVIIASLILGLVTALAHHFMNATLNDQPVVSVPVSQAWISRFATGLAFLAKTSFVLSAGSAFVQRQWLNFHRTPLKIDDIDALTSVLANFFEFFGRSTWFHNPLLALVAVVAWILPFAAVVTPGTLTVELRYFQNVTHLQVPQMSFNLEDYFSDSGQQVSSVVLRAAHATAMSAQPLTIPSDFVNETYHLSFHAPAIKCGMADANITEIIKARYETYSRAYGDSVRYFSWVPTDEFDQKSFFVNGTNEPMSFDYHTLDNISNDTAKVYVSTTFSSGEPSDGQVNVTECRLQNATYEVDFGFQYPLQTINATVSTYLNDMPLSGLTFYDVPDLVSFSTDTAVAEEYCYAVIMNAFNQFLVGASVGFVRSITNRATLFGLLSINWNETETTQRGLEQLFQNITLSMLSEKSLVKDPTENDPVPVHVTGYTSKYIYHRRVLYLAYGISLIATLACAVVGLHAFWVNGASYQNSFSSFVRVTSDRELHDLINPHDDGSDPLPRHLAGVKMQISESEKT